MDRALWIVSVTIIAALSALLVWVAVSFYKSTVSPSIFIRKGEWTCTASETVTIPLLIGNVMVPQPFEQCTEYSRRQGRND